MFQRLTLVQLKNEAAIRNLYIEKDDVRREYEIWQVNDKGVGPTDGTIIVAETLAEAWSEIYYHPNAKAKAIREEREKERKVVS